MENADPTPETTPDAAAAPRSCTNCGAGMAREQDWCLECGTAAPGSINGLRPGWRAVTTTLALTLVLVGGAGAASYAALSSDASRDATASAPMGATPVAQAPPIVAAPAAPVIPAPVAPAPAPAGPTGVTTGPTVVAPKPAKTSTVPVVTPPPITTTTPQVVPTTPTKPTPTKTTTTTKTGTTSTAAGKRGSGTNATGTTDTTTTAELTPLSLGADAVSVYDPYKRSVNPGDPAEAYDGDTQTTFEFGAPDDGKEVQVGVVVDLESAKQVKGLQFTTTTPGGRVEIYATDSSTLPPDVLDTRWEHPASRSDVDGSSKASGNKAGDGVEKIVFPKGGAKYRYVLLWFTTPPKGTSRVGITELKLLG